MKSSKTLETYVIPGQLSFTTPYGKVVELGSANIEASEQVKNANFTMLFLDSVASTGIKELDFLIFLIKSMRNNIIPVITDETLAKKFEVCRQTIARWKKKLAEHHIIKYGINYIMVNPEVFYKGNAITKDKIIAKYYKLKQGLRNENT